MATPDVRVRLSAEGVAEVVGALKKVQAEGLKAGAAGAQSAKGFFSMNQALSATRTLLAQLGAAVSVGLLVGFVKSAAEAGDELGRVAQGAGATVENFSALSLAARTADVPVQALQQGLAAVNQRLQQLRDGDAGARKVFRDLGISLRDFSGKDSVEQLEAVARALAGVEDPGKRAGLAIEFFGKRLGPRLAPLLTQLSEQGLGKLIQQAERLGVLFDSETIAAADNLTDSFALLHLQVQGVTLQLVKGLQPAVTGTMEILSAELSSNVRAWEEWGKAVGLVVAEALIGLINLGDSTIAILRSIGEAMGRVDPMRRDLERLKRIKDPEERNAETRRLLNTPLDDERGDGAPIERIGRLEREARERNDERRRSLERLKGTLEKRKDEGRRGFGEDDLDPLGGEEIRGTRSIPTPDLDDAASASDRERFAKKRAQIDAELTIVRAALKARESVERRSLEEGTKSIVEAFAARRKILEESFNAEVSALERRRVLEAQDDDPAKAASAVEKITSEITVKRIEHEEALRAMGFEEQESIERSEKVQLEALNVVRRSRGLDHQVTLSEIREQGEAFERELVRAGRPATEAEGERASFEAQLKSVAEFEESMRTVDREMQSLDIARTAIHQQVEAHNITQTEGERQLLELEQQRLVQLQAMAQAAVVAAEATGNPDAVLQALQLAAAVDSVQASIDRASVSFRDFAVTASEALESGIVDALTRGVNEGRSLVQVMNDLGLAIARAVQELAALEIAKKIMSFLPKFGGGGRVAQVEFRAAKGGRVPQHLASGGRIQGPGTGTSDSILASLPAGGYVVRAKSVARPGVLGFLRGLTGGPARHSGGGRVLARVSNGEYFVHPSIVARRGVLPALESVNHGGLPATAGRGGTRGGLTGLAAGGQIAPEMLRQFGHDIVAAQAPLDLVPRFAEGGMAGAMSSVQGAAGAAGAPGSSSVDGRIQVGLDPGLVLEAMRTPEGQRVVLEVIGSNRRTIGRALRG